MNPRLPLGPVLAGLLLSLLSSEAPRFLPPAVAQGFAFHASCVVLSSALFSTGLFLSLYGLFTRPLHRYRFVLPLFSSLAMLAIGLNLYFSGYVQTAQRLDSYRPIGADSGVLAQLVEKLNASPSSFDKKRIAESAYLFFGVQLDYPGPDGRFAIYVPSSQDLASRQKIEEGAAQAANTKGLVLDKIQRDLTWFRCFFGLYLGTFFLVFFLGSLLLLIKKPAPIANLLP